MARRNKKFLVTGGEGFIGSHLVARLVEDGKEVVVIDNLSTGDKNNLNKKAKFYKLDINNSKVSEVFKKEKPDIVYYLSGPINLRRDVEDPLFERSLDFLGPFKKILDYSCALGIKKFIFISSGGAIYSDAKIIPTPESYRAHPVSIYGLANLILEKFLKDYSKLHNLNFIILRLSNVYGPKQWESGVIPSFITSILKGGAPIIYDDGNKTRDFLYIADAIEALLLAVEIEKMGIFNAGSGEEINLDVLVGKIVKALNKKIKPKYVPSQNEEARRSALDVSKTKKELGWEPKYTLDRGLKETIEYISNKLK